MPASLDDHTRDVIVKIVSTSILVLFGAAWNAQRIVNQNPVPQKKGCNPTVSLFLGCLATLALMVALSAITTTPILILGKSMARDVGNDNNTARIEVSSSINFCEMDFVDHPWIAEPANTASSIASYIPLALLGLFGPPSAEWRLRQNHSRRFAVSYITLLAIGIGSTLLHALLTGLAQGGDELPMLWFMTSLGFITLDVILTGIQKRKSNSYSSASTALRNGHSQRDTQLQTIFGLSAVGATLVYVLCRENFLPFYIMFLTCGWINFIGLIMLAFVIQWKDTTFKTTVLLPLAVCTALHAMMGLTAWVSEMLFCNNVMEQYQQQLPRADDDLPLSVEETMTQALLPWFFNRGVHLCWHCSSALLAWLGIQTLLAAKGTQLGWGDAKVAWWGAPYVTFQKTTSK